MFLYLIKRGIALLFIIGFQSSFNTANAQSQKGGVPLGNWVMYFGENTINDNWGIHSEYQARDYFIPGKLQQTLIRFGVNYYFNPNFMLTGGYGYIITEPHSKDVGFTTLENRVFQQAILRNKINNVSIEHRYRLEQRFIKNITNNHNIADHRIRYRIQLVIPFTKISNKLSNYFLATYDEIFVNLGQRHLGQYFDRNRFYIAMGYKFNSSLNVQVGYLNQVIAIPTSETPEINNNLQFAFFYNLKNIEDLIRN